MLFSHGTLDDLMHTPRRQADHARDLPVAEAHPVRLDDQGVTSPSKLLGSCVRRLTVDSRYV
jgi:hypothetical protein